MASTATSFNSNSGQLAASKPRTRRHATPELVLGKALRYLNRAISDTKLAPHTRIQAARAVLSTLHDAGVKPSQRDLALVFRKLASDNDTQRSDAKRNDGAANDASDDAGER